MPFNTAAAAAGAPASEAGGDDLAEVALLAGFKVAMALKPK
jgi:hypothetical protein